MKKRSPKVTWEYADGSAVVTQKGSYGINVSLFAPIGKKGKRVLRRLLISNTYGPGECDNEPCQAADQLHAFWARRWKNAD